MFLKRSDVPAKILKKKTSNGCRNPTSKLLVAAYAQLELLSWQSDSVKISHYFGFGHNTSVLGATSAVMEGFVRPSACDVEHPEWLPPNTFYALGVVFDSDSTISTYHIRGIVEQTYGIERNRPICITGQAFSCQAHIKTSQVGVYADHVLGQFHGVVHGSDSRWAFRSRLSLIHGLAVFTSWPADEK